MRADDKIFVPADPEAAAAEKGWRLEYEQYFVGFRALLVDVIRRAAHDWVLYRDSTHPARKAIAEDAYEWLFLEEPGHPRWEARVGTTSECMSFLSICEVLDMNPESIRQGTRNLTYHQVRNMGRTPTKRQRPERRQTVEAESVDDAACPTSVCRVLNEIDHLSNIDQFDMTLVEADRDF